eukprot:TRINITY_DN54675_c0_g1_i1.p1 TRINITY_DN54675_c0_g1~~TRINITY_DN54675_c0_g1_i1.p1  ORF type:complete len:762 (-),score=124.98 TRINITY_DN54675_c0_g1_i1:175-2460(-)
MEPGTARIIILCCMIAILFLGVHIAIMIPASLYYDESLGYKTVWWIFWLLSLPFGIFTMWAAGGGAKVALCDIGGDIFEQLVSGEMTMSDMAKGLPVSCCLFPLVGVVPLLAAGWWIMASGSYAFNTDIADNVSPTNLDSLYQKQEADVYILAEGAEGGYIQLEDVGAPQGPVFQQRKFTFPCQGHRPSRVCTRRKCNGVNQSNCFVESYFCSPLLYQKRCPGYDVFTIVPYWASERDSLYVDTAPWGLFFQYETFLFGVGQDEAMAQHWKEKSQQRFKFDKCRNSACLADIRRSAVAPFWDKNYKTTTINRTSIGEFEFFAPSAFDAFASVNTWIREVRAQEGLEELQSPVLWLPESATKLVEEAEWKYSASTKYKTQGDFLVTMAITWLGSAFLLAAIYSTFFGYYRGCFEDICELLGDACNKCLATFCCRKRLKHSQVDPNEFDPEVGDSGRGVGQDGKQDYFCAQRPEVQLAPFVELPSWWTTHPAPGFYEINPVSREVERAVQSLMDRTRRTEAAGRVVRFKVTQVLHTENGHLWANYNRGLKYVRRLGDPGFPVVTETVQALEEWHLTSGGEGKGLPSAFGELDPGCNEVLLFQGTKPKAALEMCSGNFMSFPETESENIPMYGDGLYFSDSSAKADANAGVDEDGDFAGMYAMILARVALGNVLYTSEAIPDSDALTLACTAPNHVHDSVLGDLTDQGEHRQYVVFDGDQVYPEFMIIYQRVEDELSPPPPPEIMSMDHAGLTDDLPPLNLSAS